MSSRSESLLNHIGNCIRAQTTIKQNRQWMKQQSRGRWRRWHGSGDSDRDGDGNDNGDGNGYGKGDSGNNNGNSGDDCVDGDDGDLGDDGGGGVSGDRGGDGCGNALDRLPLVNDAGVRDNDIPDETDDVDALSGVCNGSPTNDRLNPASYQ